jgi:hypothetical protein
LLIFLSAAEEAAYFESLAEAKRRRKEAVIQEVVNRAWHEEQQLNIKRQAMIDILTERVS